MRAATSIQREASTLTPAQEAEMRRMDPNGDGIIDAKEGRAIARSSAKLRTSNMKYKKGLGATLALLILAWIGNAVLMMVIVNLSKDLKVEGVSLKTMNGGSVSTHGQKNVFEVTLTVSARRLDEQGSGDIPGHSSAVAEVACTNVLLAISSIEKGDDESLVKITLGNGMFWEPRMSASSYHLLENSFGIDALYLDDKRGVLYDVDCEMSKEACESAPESLCDAVLSDGATLHDRRALTFEGAFDGDFRRRLTHWENKVHYDAQKCANAGCNDFCPHCPTHEYTVSAPTNDRPPDPPWCCTANSNFCTCHYWHGGRVPEGWNPLNVNRG